MTNAAKVNVLISW